jgi:hypothetical protein
VNTEFDQIASDISRIRSIAAKFFYRGFSAFAFHESAGFPEGISIAFERLPYAASFRFWPADFFAPEGTGLKALTIRMT